MDVTHNLIQGLALTCLFVVSCVGIWHPRYDDTATQRMGMSTTALFSFLALAAMFLDRDHSFSVTGTQVGCAIYAVGVLLKHRRRLRCERLSS